MLSSRILGIETSGISGSLALMSDGRVVAEREHHEENQHAERMLLHLDSALAESGWDKHSLTRVAVSRGPGAFTGIRMGLALAQGLELGLGLEAVSVCSLRALAVTGFLAEEGRLEAPLPGSRIIAARDARRGELFVGVFDAQFGVVQEPLLLPSDGARESLLALGEGRPSYFVGAICRSLGLECAVGLAQTGARLSERALERFARADPHARSVAWLGQSDSLERSLTPEYLRGPNLIKPKLTPSPFDS